MAMPESSEFIAALPDGLRDGADRVDFDSVAFAATLLDTFSSSSPDALRVYQDNLADAETHFDRRLTEAHVHRHQLIISAADRLDALRNASQLVVEKAAIGKQLMLQAKRSATEKGREAYLLDKQLRFLSQVAHVADVIVKLRQIEDEANQALSQGDFAGAQTLCKNFDSLLNRTLPWDEGGATSFDAITSVHTISERVGATAVRALKKVHSTMEEMCRHFDPDEYSEVLLAYRELNAGSELVDRIFSEYELCIQARNVSQHAKGKQLLQEITELLADFADILISYHKLLAYHDNQDEFERSVQRQLASKVAMIWLSIDNQAVELVRVNQAALSNQRPQIISTAYNTARRLTALGRAFATGTDENPAASQSSLLNLFRVVACRSFEGMHRQNQELIGVMLKNETWKHCDISLDDLQAIKAQVNTPLQSDQHFEDQDKVESTRALLESRNIVRFKSNPDVTLPDPAPKIDDQEFWESSQTFTPSSLAILRSVSSYLQIGKDLPPLAVLAADAAADIILLYVFTVTEVCTATRTRIVQSAGGLDNYLADEEQALLKQLRNRYRTKDSFSSVGEEVWSEISSQWNAKDFFSKTFNMGEQDTDVDLLTHVNAFVAVESMFCLKILVGPLGENLHDRVEGQQNKTMIQRQLSSTLTLAAPIRKAAYRLFAVSFGGGAETISRVASYSYDLVAEPDDPSHYTQLLIQKFRSSWKETLPPGASEIFWPLACRSLFSAVVRGFARVPVASPHGVAQMILDVRCLEQGLQAVTGLETIPGASRAKAFVEALRLQSEDELREWFQETGIQFRFRKDEVCGLAMLSFARKMDAESRAQLTGNIARWVSIAQRSLSQPKVASTSAAERPMNERSQEQISSAATSKSQAGALDSTVSDLDAARATEETVVTVTKTHDAGNEPNAVRKASETLEDAEQDIVSRVVDVSPLTKAGESDMVPDSHNDVKQHEVTAGEEKTDHTVDAGQTEHAVDAGQTDHAVNAGQREEQLLQAEPEDHKHDLISVERPGGYVTEEYKSSITNQSSERSALQKTIEAIHSPTEQTNSERAGPEPVPIDSEEFVSDTRRSTRAVDALLGKKREPGFSGPRLPYG